MRDKNKVDYLIKTARFQTVGTLMQTFDAIFTIGKRDGDWRSISCNPFNIRRA